MRPPSAPHEAPSRALPATRLAVLMITLVAYATLAVPSAAQFAAAGDEGAADLILFRASEALAASPAVGALDEALKALALSRADLSFRTDYADQPDSFRIAVVDRLLDRPLETESYVAGFADEVRAAGSLEGAGRRLRAGPRSHHRPAAGRGGARVDGAEVRGTDRARRADARPARGRRGDGRRLPRADRGRATVRGASRAVILDEEEFDPDKPIDERDREAEEEEALADELLRIAGLVDYDRLATAGALLARAVDRAIPLAVDDPTGLPMARSEFDMEKTGSSPRPPATSSASSRPTRGP